MSVAPRKRCCIVGTAPSWKQTPFGDPTLAIWSLNDAYMLGIPRADRWFELHPLDKMWFRPKTQRTVRADEIPSGHYVRPEGHLEWLKKQAETIPVFLQDAPPADWPANAHRLPIEQIHAAFGDDYWASGPSYMLALAILEGYTEVWVTGIHLSTEAEYREQRPQWEFMLGRLLGPNVKKSVKNGFRYFDGHVRIVLPESCPILAHGWKYAYESKPQPTPNPYRDELAQVRQHKQQLVKALITMPDGPQKEASVKRLQRIEIIELDCQQMLAKANQSGTLTATLQVA
jgi:hypothetical protein